MDERQRTLQRQEEDRRFVQAIWCVGIALLLEFFLFQIKDHYFNLLSTVAAVEVAEAIRTALEWVRIGAVFLILGAVIWLVWGVYMGKSGVFHPVCFLFLAMVLGATSHGILVYGEKGLNILLFLVPAWAGLGLVYFLYQVEFFISAFFTSLGGIGLWLYRQMMVEPMNEGELAQMSQTQTTFYVYLNLTLLVILAGFFLVNKAHQQGGALRLRGRDYILIADMKDGSSLWLVGLSCLVTVLSLAFALGLGSGVAYYGIYAMLGWLFVLLVYFTVKMM